MSELKIFLSGYFHQDWLLEADEPDGMISLFLASQPDRATTKGIAEQIHNLLEANGDQGEGAIERELYEVLGCYYDPKADGMSVVDWLTKLADRLERY